MDADRVIESLRRGYDAFNRRDYDTVLATLSAEFEVRERPDAPDPRHAQGPDAALAAFRSLHEEFEDYRFEEREIRVEGGHVVAVMRQSGRGRLSGVPAEGDIVHLWRVVDGDRVSGLRAFSTVEEALAAIRADSTA